MKCLLCDGAVMETRVAAVPANTPIGSVQMEALVCPKCGYTTIEGSKMAEYMQKCGLQRK